MHQNVITAACSFFSFSFFFTFAFECAVSQTVHTHVRLRAVQGEEEEYLLLDSFLKVVVVPYARVFVRLLHLWFVFVFFVLTHT